MDKKKKMGIHLAQVRSAIDDTGVFFGMGNCNSDDDPTYILKGDPKRAALMLAVWITMDEKVKTIVESAFAISKLDQFQKDYLEAKVQSESLL